MQEWQFIDRDVIDGDVELAFYRRGNEFMLRADGLELMTSSTSTSERQLVHEALLQAKTAKIESVLIGGLGLGFTLAEACNILPRECAITIIEISQKVTEWNKAYLWSGADTALSDPRVNLVVSDFTKYLTDARKHYDLILCDIDNGPHPLVHAENARLYEIEGLHLTKERLTPGGCIVYWSGCDEPDFKGKLEKVFDDVATRAILMPQAPHMNQYLFSAYKAA